MHESKVLIAGAGPVGMTLALLMARHGIETTIVEQSVETTQYPKMDLTNGRSMEIFRFIGIADELRTLGVPEDHCLDILWATCPTGHLLHRQHYPSPADQRRQAREENDGLNTTEPRLRISQTIVEAFLKTKIEEHPLIEGIFGWRVSDIEEDDKGVTTTIIHSENGARKQLRSQYVAGCDGGNSTVRRRIGSDYEGTWDVVRVCTHHFTSSEIKKLRSLGEKYYHLQFDLCTLIAQDGDTTWTVHGDIPEGFIEGDSDIDVLLEARVGEKFDHDLKLHSFWSPHLVIAEQYRVGRVFLVGDAAHQFIPTGGYGMNTGVAEAFDIAWKLAAVLNGWGGEKLLESYHVERRPIAVQNREAAAQNMFVRGTVLELYQEARAKADLEAPESEAIRQELGAAIADTYDGEYEAWGVEFGYRYQDSPVIEYGNESAPAPECQRRSFTPGTYPGVRLPAMYLEDGTPVHDLVDGKFTLLVMGEAPVDELIASAVVLSVPLDTWRIVDDAVVERILERKIVLVRPDHHVAWRGDELPADCDGLLQKISGRA